jgi:hypothetical protein
MDGVLDFVRNRLMKRNRPSMTLYRPLLLFSVHQFLAFSCLPLAHHHFFVPALLHFTVPDVSFAHLLLAVFALPPFSHFSFAIEILRRMLAERSMTKRWHGVTLRMSRWLVVVLVRRPLRTLREVRDRQAMTGGWLRVVLMIR